jgi:hypothetical protein
VWEKVEAVKAVWKGGEVDKVDKVEKVEKWKAELEQKLDNDTFFYRGVILYVDNKQARFLNLYNPIFTCVIHTRPMPRVRELYYWQLQINPSPITNHNLHYHLPTVEW